MKKTYAQKQKTKRQNKAIREAYLANKEKIDNVVGEWMNTKSNYVLFKNIVKNELTTKKIVSVYRNGKKTKRKKIIDVSTDLNIKQALNKVIRSETFTPYKERASRNIIKGLREDKGALQAFRKYEKLKDIDYSKVEYAGRDTYRYTTTNGTTVYIEIDNSPKDGTSSFKIYEEK